MSGDVNEISCEGCRRRLDDLVAGDLDSRRTDEVHHHLEECVGCAAQMEELVATVELLHRAAVVEPPEDFARTLHARLVAEAPPARPSLWARIAAFAYWKPIAWAGAGAAVVLAVMLVAPRFRHSQAVDAVVVGPVTPTFRVPASKLAVVKIDFVAEQAVEDVEFAVQLPDGLRFVSGGRELPDREFRWQGALSQGSNDIPVAVRGKHAGRYKIVARAAGGGVEATHQVVLEVTEG
jgi:anti-sigma factor RsiW